MNVVITCRERDVHRYNHRWMRPGIYGQSIDAAIGKELDRQAAVFKVKREPARLFGMVLPWGQSDEALRCRVFFSYQTERAPSSCIHNTWFGYDDHFECGDCGEWLCWVSRGEAERMNLFTTKLERWL